jgi:2,4-dienoyl-CoA reductase-like NADH-dependent reductase (Old Yellow Enzyme family)
LVKKWSPIHNYNVEAAMEIKKHIKIPVIAVGGIRDIKQIENIISEDRADYVPMSRPFVREPDLVKKFFSGIEQRSKCIDCGYCLWGLYTGPLRCYNGKL